MSKKKKASKKTAARKKASKKKATKKKATKKEATKKEATKKKATKKKTVAKKKAKAAPRVMQDKVLGVCQLARDMGCFMGARCTAKFDYELMIDAPEPDDDKKVAKLIHNARKLLLQTERDLPKIRDAAADKLLSVCNENWREGKRPISRAAFKRQLNPVGMHIWPSGTTLYLGSGDLFWDHGVEVRLSPRGKVNEVLVS